MRERFILFENQASGFRGDYLTQRVVAELSKRGASVTRFTELIDLNFHSKLRSSAYDAALISGGDGTIRWFASYFSDLKIPIGIIPRGTGNVFAEEIYLPKNPKKLAEILISGPEKIISGARINDEAFFLMAGIGLDGEIIKSLNIKTKERFGKAAYITSTLSALLKPDPEISLSIDGRSFQCAWTIIANARRYAGAFTLSRDAGFEKEGLTAILFEKSGRLGRFWQLLSLTMGPLKQTRGIRFIKANNISIRAESNVPVQVDGDMFGSTPIEIKWGEPSLKVIVPHSYLRMCVEHEKKH